MKLQGQYVDFVRAYQDIESVKKMIHGVRSRVDDFHSQMYQDVLTLSESVGVTESAPRRASRQQHRSNAPSDNVSDYYKQNLTMHYSQA